MIYGCVIKLWHNQKEIFSRLFNNREDALQYAQGMYGVIKVREVGGEVIWERVYYGKEA